MKKLIIVESPAKIKTISKFLDKDFKIMSTMGHVKDLPTKTLGVTINGSIDIDYVPLEGKEKVIADICKEAQGADAIYLGPDPDREGELIAWHIAQEIAKVRKKKKNSIYRIAFNEITKPAILEAIAHPGTIDDQKVAAQQARRVLDRWVGYEVSPILWKKITSGLSAGRVQSVALRLICDREEAIRGFKPEEYWTIHGNFLYHDAVIIAALSHIGTKKADIAEKKTADKIVADLKKQSYIIDSVTDKTRTKNPAPPFMTSTIQQAAYNQLGFSVKKTMQIAQQLYEGLPLQDPKTPIALITYMRTDSLRVSDTALKSVRDFIKKEYSKEYLPPSVQVYEKKSKAKAQDAHEAIRPIDVAITPHMIKKYVPTDAYELYELIWKRFVASQMTAAQYAQRQVVIKGGKYIFKVTGSTLIFDGFLKVYNAFDDEEKEEKVVLPKEIKAKDETTLKNTEPKQHFTQPPPRYSEASLVKDLEKEGIGRPSTYATILNTIRARAYTTLEKKRFVPTELGMVVTKMLVEHLPKIMDTKFTAHMEEDLDKIAHGDMERDALLRSFYGTFQEDLAAFRGSDGQRKIVPTDIECPQCKKGMLAIRFGKAGEFLGCSLYPECTFTSNFTRDEQGKIVITKPEAPQLLEEKCPQCGKPLRKLRGKFGDFVACSGYPECKYIKQNKADFPCPLCGGEVVEKVWRGGKFWGCNNYPTCKFSVFDQMIKEACPLCKWPFLIQKGEKILCANKECGYKQE
ncbi:MAG TPA: type I DNA topoisomerase [Candidatus Bathyarchaeia archaeon]|nr:type I DNA topoisomerase [Candidatus Bathyarchaeia archaeon]